MHNITTTAYVVSHIGTIRQNHEDNFLLNNKVILPNIQKQMTLQNNSYVTEFAIKTDVSQIFAVSDGMGGHNAGEVASFITVRMLCDLQRKSPRLENLEAYMELYQKHINKINTHLLEQSKFKPELKDMGATLTTLIVGNGKIGILNIGDSRAYRFVNNKLQQISKDNTEGQRFLNLKLLTENELQKFPHRKTLNKYLGMNTSQGYIVADSYIIDNLNAKEWFLLCSDGLTDAISSDEIEEVLKEMLINKDIKKSVEKLLNIAIMGSDEKEASKDNITIMLIQVEV